jgi:hypothetical protein
MKKLQILKAARIAHLAIWTIIALTIIVSTCKVWWANGCGASSLICAILFYGATCTGRCIFGHIHFDEEIEETEAILKATQGPSKEEK